MKKMLNNLVQFIGNLFGYYYFPDKLYSDSGQELIRVGSRFRRNEYNVYRWETPPGGFVIYPNLKSNERVMIVGKDYIKQWSVFGISQKLNSVLIKSKKSEEFPNQSYSFFIGNMTKNSQQTNDAGKQLDNV